jgi:hypothetical protein
MTCSDLEEVIFAHFEGALDVFQSRALHCHLSECEPCLLHFISYQSLLILLREEARHLNRTWKVAEIKDQGVT